jgi:hypothetical protein
VNKKAKILMFFAVLLAATMLMTPYVYADGYTLWYDNFNDNSLSYVWTRLHHGYAEMLEINQRQEAYVYYPLPGENWMSCALKLMNAFCFGPYGCSVSLLLPSRYWEVERVDVVWSNEIYNPMSEHRRYTLEWRNAGNPDHLGNVYAFKQIGTTKTCIGFMEVVPHFAPEEAPLMFWMSRVGEEEVYFQCGEYYNSMWHYLYVGRDYSWIFGDNDYPHCIFDAYGTLDYEFRWTIFDDFYISELDYYPPPPYIG